MRSECLKYGLLAKPVGKRRDCPEGNQLRPFPVYFRGDYMLSLAWNLVCRNNGPVVLRESFNKQMQWLRKNIVLSRFFFNVWTTYVGRIFSNVFVFIRSIFRFCFWYYRFQHVHAFDVNRTTALSCWAILKYILLFVIKLLV